MTTATLEKTRTKKIARTWKVLVPIIKQDIRDMEAAADEAQEPYRIKIGAELHEARLSFSSALLFFEAAMKTFLISRSTVERWMRAGANVAEGLAAPTDTVTRASGDRREFGHPPT